MNIEANIRAVLAHLNCKTLIFNFHYLPIREAIHLPFFLSRNTKLKSLKGSVKISDPKIRPGMIRIGTEEVGFYDKRHNRAVWENAGEVEFQGVARIKFGASITVSQGGKLKLGDGFRLSSGSRIVCYKSIIVGRNCRISWDVQLIDTDFHRIFDENKKHINPDKEIRIGNDCWIGNNSFIQKGSVLGNMLVVASNSMVNSHIPEDNVILAGSPARIKRAAITWSE